MMVFGSTGCGKTRRLLAVAILFALRARVKRSQVIIDVKKELFKMTMREAIRQGYNVEMIDFRDPANSPSAWNPFSYANKLYREGKVDEAWRELDSIAALIFNDGQANNVDPFWKNSCIAVFKGIVDLIWRSRNCDVTPQLVMEIRNQMPIDTTRAPVYDEAEKLGKRSLAWQGMQIIRDASEKTAGNIFACFNTYMAPMTGREDLMRLLSARNSFRFEELGAKPTVLYICLADDDTSTAGLQGILLQQLVQKLNLAAIENGGCLPVRTDLLIDEMCNMPVIPDLSTKLTISRSRGMRYLLVCQSYAQLIDKYRDAGPTIATNCATWVMMYCAKDQTMWNKARDLAVENLFGENLIDPSKLALMPMGQALVFSEHKRPYVTLLDDISQILPKEEEARPAVRRQARRRATVA